MFFNKLRLLNIFTIIIIISGMLLAPSGIVQLAFAQDATNGISLTEEERQWLSDNNIIKVGVDPTVSPQEAIDQFGNISGISGEYLNIIAEMLDVKFEWAGSNNWSEAIAMIRSGEADILSAASNTPERNEFLFFTDDYITTSNAIYIRSGGDVFGTVDSLEGRKLAQIRGFSTTNLLKINYPNIEIIEVGSIEEALSMVSEGDVDAYIGDIPFSMRAITREGLTNILVSGTISAYGGNAIATRKELPLLASALQKAVNSITSEQHQEIANIWLNDKIEIAPDYDLIWQIVLSATVIILVILLWANSMRQEVQRRRAAEKAAEIANASKSDFLTSMSHDLRTPLNAIIGFSETMKMETFGPISNKKYLDYSKDIHSAGVYLHQLVNDILDLSELEAGKKEFNYKTVDVAEIANECQNIVHKLAEDKNIQLDIYIPSNFPKVYGDEKTLMQILMNLISNSIKFTPPSGNISISTNISDKNYTIQVTDTGIGISEKDIKIITEPFTRAIKSPLLQHKEGTGLGLAIVKSLVFLNNGKLNITSEINKGTAVTVSFPIILAHTDIKELAKPF